MTPVRFCSRRTIVDFKDAYFVIFHLTVGIIDVFLGAL